MTDLQGISIKRAGDIFRPWVAQKDWAKDYAGFYRVLGQMVSEASAPLDRDCIKEAIRTAYQSEYGDMHYSGGALYAYEDRGGIILDYLAAQSKE